MLFSDDVIITEFQCDDDRYFLSHVSTRKDTQMLHNNSGCISNSTKM